MNRFSLILAFVMASVSLCLAQVQERTYQRIEQAGAILAGERSVRAELKLTSAQGTQLDALYAGYLRDQKAVYEAWQKDLEPSQIPKYEKRLEEISNALATGVLASLTVEQRLRLRQIVLQQIGPQALRNKAVTNDLGLSVAQLKKVNALFAKLRKQKEAFEAEFQKRLSALPKPTSFEEGLEFDRKRAEIEKGMSAQAGALDKARLETDASVLAVLTPAQRKKWEAMLGRPFSLPKG